MTLLVTGGAGFIGSNFVLDWLAQSAYQSAHKPDFERYGAAFDPDTGSGEVELWLAVLPRQAIA